MTQHEVPQMVYGELLLDAVHQAQRRRVHDPGVANQDIERPAEGHHRLRRRRHAGPVFQVECQRRRAPVDCGTRVGRPDPSVRPVAIT